MDVVTQGFRPGLCNDGPFGAKNVYFDIWMMIYHPSHVGGCSKNIEVGMTPIFFDVGTSSSSRSGAKNPERVLINVNYIVKLIENVNYSGPICNMVHKQYGEKYNLDRDHFEMLKRLLGIK